MWHWEQLSGPDLAGLFCVLSSALPSKVSDADHWELPAAEMPESLLGTHVCVFACSEFCICRTNPEEIEASVGTTSLNGTDGGAVKVNVTRVIPHPLFNPIMLDFDVAVLELARPLVFNKHIQPVCLPLAAQEFAVGQQCLISGWGNLQEGNGEQ